MKRVVGCLDRGLGLGVASELTEDLAHVLLGLCEGRLGLWEETCEYRIAVEFGGYEGRTCSSSTEAQSIRPCRMSVYVLALR